MRKSVALLLIAAFFFISCGKRQETTVEQVDNRTHYLKVKRYYALYRLRGVVDLEQTDKELEWKLDKYRKTLGELDLAVFETTGDAREEVMEMIEECNDNIDLIREELDKRARNLKDYKHYERRSRYKPRYKNTWTKEEMKALSTQNDAIAASKAEIERKRSAVGAE